MYYSYQKFETKTSSKL